MPARPSPTYCRLSRYDATGLIWLLQGRAVVALTADEAAIQGSSAVLVYRKHRKPALGPLGDSLDDIGACSGGFRCDDGAAPGGDQHHEVCAQCGAGRPDDPPTVAVRAKDGRTVYVHERGCLRFWKKEHGDVADDYSTILPCLDRRGGLCEHCGQPGGIEWDYESHKVWLHSRCERAWLDARCNGATEMMTTEVRTTVEYLNALRKAAGLAIDPETAEVEWSYAQTLDPYGDDPKLPEEYQQVGRAYFARSPKSDVWISFYDLPDATRDALWKKHKSRLVSPAGLELLAWMPDGERA